MSVADNPARARAPALRPRRGPWRPSAASRRGPPGVSLRLRAPRSHGSRGTSARVACGCGLAPLGCGARAAVSRALAAPHASPPPLTLASPPAPRLPPRLPPPARSIKTGKVVIVLNGRFAGRKAVVIRTFDDGAKDRKFGHALVAGIDRAPRKVTKKMDDKKKVRGAARRCGARARATGVSGGGAGSGGLGVAATRPDAVFAVRRGRRGDRPSLSRGSRASFGECDSVPLPWRPGAAWEPPWPRCPWATRAEPREASRDAAWTRRLMAPPAF